MDMDKEQSHMLTVLNAYHKQMNDTLKELLEVNKQILETNKQTLQIFANTIEANSNKPVRTKTVIKVLPDNFVEETANKIRNANSPYFNQTEVAKIIDWPQSDISKLYKSGKLNIETVMIGRSVCISKENLLKLWIDTEGLQKFRLTD